VGSQQLFEKFDALLASHVVHQESKPLGFSIGEQLNPRLAFMSCLVLPELMELYGHPIKMGRFPMLGQLRARQGLISLNDCLVQGSLQSDGISQGGCVLVLLHQPIDTISPALHAELLLKQRPHMYAAHRGIGGLMARRNDGQDVCVGDFHKR